MRIGILVTNLGEFAKKGYYNTQEIGLARAMDYYFDEVKVYKLVSDIREKGLEAIEGCTSASIELIFANGIGKNGIINTDILDRRIDALIYFADIQFAMGTVYKWAQKNNVYLLPYVGVIESHSEKKLFRIVLNFLARRNIRIYKKCYCLAKTPEVEKKLRQAGVRACMIAPVGLDVSLLESDYKSYNKDKLKENYGYEKANKVLLFIGRMVKEKEPQRMVSIFADLIKIDKNYRLLMVGTGPLKREVIQLAESKGVIDKIQLIDRVPNSIIWSLYRMADVYINLNSVEIFGMALLEAMYYECNVVAWKAPGPDYIIENGVSGWIVESENGVIKKIMDEREMGAQAHCRVISSFTWDITANKISKLLENTI